MNHYFFKDINNSIIECIYPEKELEIYKEYYGDPALILTDKEYQEACGIVYVRPDGNLQIGLTDREKTLNKIEEYRINLKNTDYITAKLAEAIGDEDRIQALKAEYSDILAQRAEWRKYINDNM